ncbi:MAG: hydroxysqualene dehydroxylase HpnE [Actinomycetia bacterium]|nr:hydroxysqualene dehydroxylase HpnE [Actinomycetes bacterium]
MSAASSAKSPSVVVVGGGLAGLAAALDLADAGAVTTLFEARPTLGGAVQTLPERASDPSPPPDNGQHVALGCCSEYLRFLDRIGQAHSLDRIKLSMPVIDEARRQATIGSGLTELLGYRHLSLRERFSVARVVRRLGRLMPEAHDHETFGDLLRRLGQADRVIDRFWDVFMRPALNLRTDEASAALGVFTVKIALLGPKGASDLLIPRAPLGAMHGEAAAAALERASVTLRLRARVSSLEPGGLCLSGGERVPAGAVVLAVPPEESAALLGEQAPALQDSPIVSVHLWLDRRILGPPLAALLGSPAHWIFDRGRLMGHEPHRGQYLTVVSSGAPELMEERGRDIVELMVGELTARLGEAEPLWSRVSREPCATFAGRPGTATLRPGVETGRGRVVRAGAWTQTGWPATMEGAVRSGRTAAAAALAHIGG